MGSSSSAGKYHRILHKSGGHGLGINQCATELNVMSIDLALCVPATASRMNGSSSSASNCHRTSHESGGQRGTELNVRSIDLAFQTVFTAWECDQGMILIACVLASLAKAKFTHSSSPSSTTTPFAHGSLNSDQFFNDLAMAQNSSGLSHKVDGNGEFDAVSIKLGVSASSLHPSPLFSDIPSYHHLMPSTKPESGAKKKSCEGSFHRRRWYMKEVMAKSSARKATSGKRRDSRQMRTSSSVMAALTLVGHMQIGMPLLTFASCC